jgi:TetR/AcrR family tetracycline transcriptional repressor
MTKTQGRTQAKIGLTLDRVLAAAFDVLEASGIAKLSTRMIAAELDVSMNTVMWHIRTKDRLLDLMADHILGEIALDDLPGDWHAQATQLLGRLRLAMLAHRDGASIVAGTFPIEPHTLAFADRLVTALFDGCPSRRSAAWTSWNLLYFALGLVQEEQAASGAHHDRLREATDEQALPGLHSVLEHFVSIDYEQRFRFGIEQILRSAAVMEASEQ